MNKQDYLNKLEQLLTDNKIENTYRILRDYSNKIDDKVSSGQSFDDIVKELGTPEEILREYVINGESNEDTATEKKYDNDDEVYENDTKQFKKSYFESLSGENEEIQDFTREVKEGIKDFTKEVKEEINDFRNESNSTGDTVNKERFKDSYVNDRYKSGPAIDSNLAKKILYGLIILLALALIGRSIGFFMFGTFIDGHFFRLGNFGFLSIIPTIIIVVVVVYILTKNNKK